MIRWCSYCQRFMGETEPYDDFRLSHGVCQTCANNIRHLRYHDLRELTDFFRGLFDHASKGRPIDVHKVIQDARSLGVNRADLLLGILQPILYRIGVCFAEGKLSVAKEHLFTEAVLEITQEFEKEVGPPVDASAPRVMLTLAEDNLHHVGIDFLSLLIQDTLGFPVLKFRSLSAEESLVLIQLEKPWFFGMSAALPEHWETMEDLYRLLENRVNREEKPLLAMGGPSIKNKEGPPFAFLDFTARGFDSRETLEFLKLRGGTEAGRES